MKTSKILIFIVVFSLFVLVFGYSCSESDHSKSTGDKISIEEAKKIVKKYEEKKTIEQAEAIVKQQELDQSREFWLKRAKDYKTAHLKLAVTLAYGDAALKDIPDSKLNVISVYNNLPNKQSIIIEPPNKIKGIVGGKIYMWTFIPPDQISDPIEGETIKQPEAFTQQEIDQLSRDLKRDEITLELRVRAATDYAKAVLMDIPINRLNIASLYNSLTMKKGSSFIITIEPPNRIKANIAGEIYLWNFTPPAQISDPKRQGN